MIRCVPIVALDDCCVVSCNSFRCCQFVIGVRIEGLSTIDAIAGFDFWKPQDVTELKIKAMLGCEHKSNSTFK